MTSLGADLIKQERTEQLVVHGKRITYDVEINCEGQLAEAASKLAFENIFDIHGIEDAPKGWNEELWLKMINKPYKQRIIIAGALLAAEFDRISYAPPTPRK